MIIEALHVRHLRAKYTTRTQRTANRETANGKATRKTSIIPDMGMVLGERERSEFQSPARVQVDHSPPPRLYCAPNDAISYSIYLSSHVFSLFLFSTMYEYHINIYTFHRCFVYTYYYFFSLFHFLSMQEYHIYSGVYTPSITIYIYIHLFYHAIYYLGIFNKPEICRRSGRHRL